MNYDNIISKIFFSRPGRIHRDKMVFNYVKFQKFEKKEYPNIKSYLESRFVDGENLKAIIYRIKYHIETIPVCKTCGKKLNIIYVVDYVYPEYCSKSCANKGKDKINKAEKTCLEKYGVKSAWCQEKKYQTLERKYGSRNWANSEVGKKHLSKIFPETNKKRIKTWIEKYNAINSFVSENTKKIYLEKYGVDNPMKSPSIKEKIIEAKRRNHTFNTSKPEEELYIYIKNKFPDVIRQYKSEAYPFACDFYIPTLDYYIELQGIWIHGRHAFNLDSKEDRLTLEQWKEKAKTSRFYKTAIDVWTISDVNKRETAKLHNLKYKEVWSLEEGKQFIDTL